jgi:hypothetical protein
MECNALQNKFRVRIVCRRIAFHKGGDPHLKKEWHKRRMLQQRVRRTAAMVAKLRLKLKDRSQLQVLTKDALNKNLTSLGQRLKLLSEQGHLLGQTKSTALQIATSIISNLSAKEGGARHNQVAKAFAAVIRAKGGRALYEQVRVNLGLPSERVGRRFLRADGETVWNARLTDADFQVLAGVFKSAMERAGIPLGSVPPLAGEDETGVYA